MMYVHTYTHAGACGVAHAHRFRTTNDYESSERIDELDNAGGCNWLTAGFTNTPICREAYVQFCRSYKLLYQSPVRVNDNSGNNFFFAVFDTRHNPDGSRR